MIFFFIRKIHMRSQNILISGRSGEDIRKKKSGRLSGMPRSSGLNWFRVYRHLKHPHMCKCLYTRNQFGIELVPCIQTLAHMRMFLRWPVTEKMRDNGDILLVGEPAVYEFLEDMIRSVRTSFSGRRIHIGMDEAFQLGLGNYLRKNGYQDRTGIMKEHLDRVCEICRKYDFRSEEHTSELQSRFDLVCRLLLEKKKKHIIIRV